jgi:D-lactate dehydrogenase
MKIAMYDSKPYDKEWFEKEKRDFEFIYIESKLNYHTAKLAEDCDGVCAFVNDVIDGRTIERLYGYGIGVIAMRCAGYSNVDFRTAYEKIHVVRVPKYSPYAVAEFTMGLLLSINRKIHKAYNRTREFNFSLVGLTGTDLHGKTVGVIGTGKIGQCFIDVCKGFGMNILTYDPYPNDSLGYQYVDLDTLLRESDIISLHCPLTEQNWHILDRDAFDKMKKGVYILNTSRGALIDSEALLDKLNDGTVAGTGLDVYEEEADFFFQDVSTQIMKDDVLALLVSKPNVILTSHQAFLTEEALSNIARITVDNLEAYFEGKALDNEVCYQCKSGKISENCEKRKNGRCF